MADITQIQVGSTTYDIKDATARTNAATAQSTADGKVSKSGDTMTGNLIESSGGKYISKHPVADVTTQPTNDIYDSALELQDKNGVSIGSVSYFVSGDVTGLALSTEREVNGSSVYHGISLYINGSGTRYIYLSGGKQVWQEALGLYWYKAGTATGTSTVSIPNWYSEPREVMAIVQPGNNSAKFSSTMIISELSSIWFVGGYHSSSSDYALVNLNVTNSNMTYQLRNVKYGNGSDLKSTSKLTIYYR